MKLVDRIFLALIEGLSLGGLVLFGAVLAFGITEGAPWVVYAVFGVAIASCFGLLFSAAYLRRTL